MKSSKKIIAALLSLITIISHMGGVLFTEVKAASASAPLVYIYGEHNVYVRQEDGSWFNPRDTYDNEIISESVPELLPLFAKALVTNDYGEWSEAALEKLSPIYADIKPSPDGTVPENTFVEGHWDKVNLATDYGPLGSFYNYIWDMRLSPLDFTEDLHNYIETVKARTGSDKIVLASRCGGAALMAAYLTQYGYDDIEKAIFFCNNLFGFNHADLTLSGKITVNGEAFDRWLNYEDKLAGFGLDEELYKFLMAMISALDSNGSVQDVADTVMKVYDKIKDPFIAPFLREYFGICGGYVANVGDNYEAYRDYIFPTDELKEEYSAILSKADDFHYNVQLKAEDLLKEMDENGVPVYMLANYGEQMVAFGEKSSWLSDVDAPVFEQSFGATTCKTAQTLTDEYIASREDAGFGKYISPDRQIDASTGLFPERTFYIKNLRHDYYSDSAEYAVQKVAYTPDLTIDTLADFPQFLTCDKDLKTVTPAKAVNDADIDWSAYDEQNKLDGAEGLAVRLIAFFAKVFSVFRQMILKISSLFKVG